MKAGEKKVAVIIPTVTGREEDLERCLSAYRDTAPKANLFIEHGHPSCGTAWLEGMDAIHQWGHGDFHYLHLTADDLVPHPGWLDAAVESVDAGYIPAPLVFEPNGTLDSAGLEGFERYRGPHLDWQAVQSTTVPFLTRQMWERITACRGVYDLLRHTHYCTDLVISEAGRRCGWATAIRTGMSFTHHTAAAGRNYDRAPADTREYAAWRDEPCAS